MWLVIGVIFVFGILAVCGLIYREFVFGDMCPKFFGIPACYILIFLFIIPFLSHLFKLNKVYYFVGTGLAFLMALYGTIMNVLGELHCPTTESGLPMCYISLFIFICLILLKILYIRTNHWLGNF